MPGEFKKLSLQFKKFNSVNDWNLDEKTQLQILSDLNTVLKDPAEFALLNALGPEEKDDWDNYIETFQFALNLYSLHESSLSATEKKEGLELLKLVVENAALSRLYPELQETLSTMLNSLEFKNLNIAPSSLTLEEAEGLEKEEKEEKETKEETEVKQENEEETKEKVKKEIEALKELCNEQLKNAALNYAQSMKQNMMEVYDECKILLGKAIQCYMKCIEAKQILLILEPEALALHERDIKQFGYEIKHLKLTQNRIEIAELSRATGGLVSPLRTGVYGGYRTLEEESPAAPPLVPEVPHDDSTQTDDERVVMMPVYAPHLNYTHIQNLNIIVPLIWSGQVPPPLPFTSSQSGDTMPAQRAFREPHTPL